jgi:O-methyltransferase
MTATVENQMYLDLLKKVLVDYPRIKYTEYKSVRTYNPNFRTHFLLALDKILRLKDFAVCKVVQPQEEDRMVGKDWPIYADTMIGMKRLENVEYCVQKVLDDKIEGDFIETGVWRGGTTILMRAILKTRGVTDRKVWVADSFEGLPKPDGDKYEADKGDTHHTMRELAISKEIVEDNFRKYGLLDDQVKFLKGWFKDTLPTAPLQKIGLEGCRRAIDDYRKTHNITEPIHKVDWTGVYWRKER